MRDVERSVINAANLLMLAEVELDTSCGFAHLFHAHLFGHHDNAPVTFDGRNQSDADTYNKKGQFYIGA